MRTFYFGGLADWQAAYPRFEREWPYLIQGKTPPAIDSGEGLTVRDLCNAFIEHKGSRTESGELTGHSYAGYSRASEELIEFFGESRFVNDLRPDDIERFRAELAEGCNFVTLGSKINRLRVILMPASRCRPWCCSASTADSGTPTCRACRSRRSIWIPAG